MKTSKVKWFDKEKGYGFIYFENNDYYFTVRDVNGADLPCTGDMVSFEPANTEKGYKASNVTIVESAPKQDNSLKKLMSNPIATSMISKNKTVGAIYAQALQNGDSMDKFVDLWFYFLKGKILFSPREKIEELEKSNLSAEDKFVEVTKALIDQMRTFQTVVFPIIFILMGIFIMWPSSNQPTQDQPVQKFDKTYTVHFSSPKNNVVTVKHKSNVNGEKKQIGIKQHSETNLLVR